MKATLLIRREGEAVQVGACRVEVVFTQDGRALLHIEHPDGVRVVPAEVLPAVVPEPNRVRRA